MKKIEISIAVQEFDSENELAAEDKSLLVKARKSAEGAYAPYSEFFVGAAVQLQTGKTVSGNNQENIAFPSGLCAERVAVFSAAAQFPNVGILSVAISCKSKNFSVTEPLTPCGACRQVLMEYENRQGKNIRVIVSGEKGKVWIFESVKDLLPFAFNVKGFKKNSGPAAGFTL